MKRTIGLISFICILLSTGCVSTIPEKKNNDEPRRVFSALENIDSSLKDPFIINEYISDNIIYSKASTYFSTALLLADIGIINATNKIIFQKYTSLFFTGLPALGQTKELVIPNLSTSENQDIERNAYFFITKQKNNEGIDYFLIETNIPISSHYSRTYDGYFIKINNDFYKNNVPARWTSIMNIAVKNNILLYRGLAYPSKSAPLIFTGTGIGADPRMNAVVTCQSSITETRNALQEAVNTALDKAKSDNEQNSVQIKFLEKYANLSYSVYYYLEGNFREALRYFNISKNIEVEIPNNTMGSRLNELEIIMGYLINVIGAI